MPSTTDFPDPYQRTVESAGSDPFSYAQFLARYRVTVERVTGDGPGGKGAYYVRRGRLSGAVFRLDKEEGLSPEEVIGRLGAQALAVGATPGRVPTYLDLSVDEHTLMSRYWFKHFAHNAEELRRVLGEEAFQALLYQTEIRF
jgi:hypothetical protein